MTSIFKSSWNRLLTYFVTGILTVLPVAITLVIVTWLANFVLGLMGPDTFIGNLLKSLGLGVSKDDKLAYAIGILFVLAIIGGLGAFVVEFGARNAFQRMMDVLLDRLPLVNSIYRSAKQLVGMLDKKDDVDLQGMTPVYLQMGERGGTGLLGLLVSPEPVRLKGCDHNVVIVPTAPIPFGGALFFVPSDRIEPAEMSVDGLVSVYMSMGATAPQFMTDETAARLMAEERRGSGNRADEKADA